VGNGGDINITTGLLSVTNGAELSTDTDAKGDAGNINILARNKVSFDGVSSTGRPRGAYSRVGDHGAGNSGNINITAGSLSVTNGALVSTSTLGKGNAGRVTINARDTVSFDGVGRPAVDRIEGYPSSASSVVAKKGIGNGGNVIIKTGSLFVTNGANVSVSSEGLGNAGDLIVEARYLFLNNQGKLLGSTASDEGGNIDLRVRDLILMRQNSLISAEALDTANGGNINIDSDFIVAVPSEDSDIIAKAFRGNGGRIGITTSGIFGLKYRDRPTPTSSDITASSELGVDGVVEIDTPDIDSSRGLVELPLQLSETEVVQACQPGGSQQQSEFIVAGSGGLPPNPSDPLNSDALWIDLDSTAQLAENRPSSKEATWVNSSTTQSLVEATGWALDDKGNVVLTASAPTAAPRGVIPAKCHAS
jgi:large exoprotein involved in heme utilization and adhesion